MKESIKKAFGKEYRKNTKKRNGKGAREMQHTQPQKIRHPIA